MSVIDLQAYAPCCELKILLWLEKVSLIMLTISTCFSDLSPQAEYKQQQCGQFRIYPQSLDAIGCFTQESTLALNSSSVQLTFAILLAVHCPYPVHMASISHRVQQWWDSVTYCTLWDLTNRDFLFSPSSASRTRVCGSESGNRLLPPRTRIWNK